MSMQAQKPRCLNMLELAVARQADQRIALEDAALLRGKIGQEIAVEEEITAVDPVVNELGLLAELLDLGRPRPSAHRIVKAG